MSAPCGRAGRGPSKYRHQVCPARDRFWRPEEGGRRPVTPAETPPAPLSAVAAGGRGRVPGPERAEGRSRCGSSAEGAGARWGRGRLQGSGTASPGARVLGCALRPLLAALRGRALLQSQLLLPSTCEGGAQTEGGTRGPPTPPAAGKSSTAASMRSTCRPPKSVKSNRALCVHAPSPPSAPPGCDGELHVPTSKAGH